MGSHHYRLIYVAFLVTLLGSQLVASVGETDFDDRSCGRQQVSLKGLIKGGYSTRPGEFPWHVALFHRDEPSSGHFEYRCGGTLVHKYLVVTAAHCVTLQSSRKRKPAGDVLVKAGRFNISEEREEQGRDYEVAAIITHSGYKPLTYENDIAIVKLAVPVIFTKYIQPACLWKRDDAVQLPYIFGREGTVIGWGLTDSNKTASILNTARMPVVDMHTCLASNRDFFGHLLYANSFCAGSRNGTGVCNGDSGGGMVFKHENQWYLRGVVSFSNTLDATGLCNLMMYVGFTDAGAYLQWIYENAPAANSGDRIEGHPNIRFINQGSCGQNEFRYGHPEEQKPIIKQYPWMVHLRHPLQDHSYVPCNGVLINKNYILTTTCVDWNDEVAITLGDYRTNEVRDCGVRSNNENFCLDPAQSNSVAEWFQKDVLILARLASPARIGRGSIEAACLPTSPEMRQRTYAKYILTGWKESGNDSHFLQRALVDYVQPSTCNKEFARSHQKSDPSTFICVRNLADRKRSPMCNDYQPGTVLQAIDQKLNRYFAYGLQTGISYCDVPETFIKVADYLEWILDTIKP